MWSRKRVAYLVLVAGPIALLVLGLVWMFWWSTATHHLARTFDLADTSSAEGIEAGLLGKFPPGTPLAEVHRFLEGSGLGPAGRDRFAAVDDGGREVGSLAEATGIHCFFDYDPLTPLPVKEHYFVGFSFDGEKRLASVRVARHLTGL